MNESSNLNNTQIPLDFQHLQTYTNTTSPNNINNNTNNNNNHNYSHYSRPTTTTTTTTSTNSISGESSNKQAHHTRNSSSSTGKQPHQQQYPVMEPRLLEMKFPKEYENSFVTAIFELGLKHSSPKILIPLMPTVVDLSTEHIKSHLQKYRIHQKRSKEEFELFYRQHIQEQFHTWEKNHGWESITVPTPTTLTNTNNNNNNASSTSLDQQQQQHSSQQDLETKQKSKSDSNSSLNDLDDSNHVISNNKSNVVWTGGLNESKEIGHVHHLDHLSNEDEPAVKIRKLKQLKESLTATMATIEEIKSLGKMAADDCLRFSKNLQSMINL